MVAEPSSRPTLRSGSAWLRSTVDAGHSLAVPAVQFRPKWVTEARRARAEEDNPVVLRHLDRLSDVSLRVITAALQDALRPQLNWVVITREDAAPSAEMARLLRLFPTTVEVPPLGHHVEDVEQLVPFLLCRPGPATCSRSWTCCGTWCGTAARASSCPATCPRTPPPGAVAGSARWRRWNATPLCWRSSQGRGGNKAQAARTLGMCRATIYRKIRKYGILSVG